MILTKESKEVLLHYIDTYPKKWKSEIKKDWDDFTWCTPSLRALRNTYGPTWLMNLTADKVINSQVRE